MISMERELIRQRFEAAKSWISDNPDAWDYMCGLCDYETEMKRQFSMNWAVEEARKKGILDKRGNYTSYNSIYIPVWSRLFVKRNPTAKGLIRQRKSMFDEFFVEEGLN